MSSRMALFRRGGLFMAGFLVLSAAARAQSTFATITGNITDPSGAPVVGVEVTATHRATNYAYRASTNEAGLYTLANLREGVYRLRAKAGGFQEYSVDNIEVAGRDLRRVDIALVLGSVETVVEVTGAASLIETETARISDVRDRQLMNNLPLTLRRSWDFFQLSPQVSKPAGAWYIRFAGSRNRQGDFSIDGATVANVFGGPITGVISDRTESFQEFRIDMAGNSAEYAGIGQISAVTRAGTNELHGSAFYYYTTPGMTARNPFALVRTGEVEHVPGGAIGGPIYVPKVYDGRNRSFFFTSMEWERFGSASKVVTNPTVPLQAWRTGDFSQTVPAAAIRDPLNGGAPFANRTIPASRLNPAAVKIQNFFYPQPNFGSANTLAAQNYRDVRLVEKEINPTMVLRFDHRFSDEAFVFWRLTKTDWTQKGYTSSLPAQGRQDGNRWSRASSIAYTHTIRPTLLSEFRWGFASDNIPSKGALSGLQQVKELGLQGLAPNLPDRAGVFNVAFSGIGLTGISGGGFCNPCANYFKHSFSEHLTSFRGKHSLKGGFYLARGAYKDVREDGALFGSHTYSNRYTGHPYADFLLGMPTTARRAFPTLGQSTWAWDWALFVQDEYRIRPDLTLTFGLRYELKPGFSSENGLQSVFDVGSGKIIVPDGALGRASKLMPLGYVEVAEAKSAGLGATLIRADKNNIAPRFGFAWRPGGNNRNVVRGGFGLYYDIAPRNPALSSVPFQIAEPAFNNPAGTPLIVLPFVFPSTGTGGPSTVSIPRAINPDIRIPYSMQYTLTLERQQWDTGFRLSYTGTNTRHGVWGYDFNSPVADSRPYVDKPRAFPKYPGINYVTNGAGHQYHALTFEAERRMKNGLHAQFYYTLARDIGDLEDGQSPEYAYDRTRERAVWTDIPTHRVSWNMIYELPFGRNRKWMSNAGRMADGVLGGWQIGAIYNFDTGNFLTPLWTGPDPTGTRYTGSRTPANVTIRPDHLRDANLSNPAKNRWFDVSAFAPPQPGRFGTSAKGVIKGPHSNVLHSTVSKNFLFRERFRFRVEAVATNLTNTPNYRDPNTNITSAAAVGVLTAVHNRNTKMDMAIPRVVQFILRMQF